MSSPQVLNGMAVSLISWMVVCSVGDGGGGCCLKSSEMYQNCCDGVNLLKGDRLEA